MITFKLFRFCTALSEEISFIRKRLHSSLLVTHNFNSKTEIHERDTKFCSWKYKTAHGDKKLQISDRKCDICVCIYINTH